MSDQFEQTFKSLLSRYKVKEEDVRKDLEFRTLLVDFYYAGKLHGIQELSKRLEDDQNARLAVSKVSTPAVS